MSAAGARKADGVLLDIADLCAGYGEMQVLRDISLNVRHAEIVAMVGGNGAGKTTLLRAVSRLIPSRGNFTFDGRSLRHASADDVFALGLVQVPEGRQLFDRMSVHDNLLMGAFRRRECARAPFPECPSVSPGSRRQPISPRYARCTSGSDSSARAVPSRTISPVSIT
jgi:ABC-type branched-subunit amino acid transport system ATPase component